MIEIGDMARKVVAINRRSAQARLDDGRVIPIVEGFDRRGKLTTDYRDAVVGVAEIAPSVGYIIEFKKFPYDASS